MQCFLEFIFLVDLGSRNHPRMDISLQIESLQQIKNYKFQIPTSEHTTLIESLILNPFSLATPLNEIPFISKEK